MAKFLKLINFQNLLLLILVQCLIRYALLLPFTTSHGVVLALSDYYFIVLVLSSVCIAGGGYIIGAINIPENKHIFSTSMSEKNVYNAFIILNILGVGLGFYLSHAIGKPALFVLFFASSALLYLHASALRQIPLVGNIVVAIVVALGILGVGIFELFPILTYENKAVQITFLKIIADYAMFSFLLSLISALLKDIATVSTDEKYGIQTLPVVLGRQRTTLFAFILTVALTVSVVYYVITFLFQQLLIIVYFLGLVIAPLVYVCIKLNAAKNPSDFKKLRHILHVVFVTTILSMLLFNLVLL